MSRPEWTHLGDGLYVHFHQGTFRLHVNDHRNPPVAFFEREHIDKLQQFAAERPAYAARPVAGDPEPPDGTSDDVAQIISHGRCQCLNEPRGDNGLEGYQLGLTYRFEEVRLKGKRHFRVYPGTEQRMGRRTTPEGLVADTEYYETCGPKIFNRHFQKV